MKSRKRPSRTGKAVANRNKEDRPLADLDDLDRSILKILHDDSRTPVQLISEKVGKPASTIHYRLKKMKESTLIEGYFVKINPTMAQRDNMHIIQVRTHTAAKNYKIVGKQLANIDGIWAVYFVLGDWDFILLCRSENRESFLNIVKEIADLNGVERSSSISVGQIIKEDPRIEF
jgi:Lrp/AsnC family transcriptional regulator for asnA, asnC and gidA